MTFINTIIKELRDTGIKRYGLINKDGRYFENNLSLSAKKILLKMIFENKDIPVNSYIKRKLGNSDQTLYIYKIAFNGFLICTSSTDIKIILDKFVQIALKFGFLLYKYFKSQKSSIQSQKISVPIQKISAPPQKTSVTLQNRDEFTTNEPITAIILSKNKDFVPEPVAWIPMSINEEEALRIATKGLVLILGDTDKIKECYSLIHFLNRKQIGLIYLFEIPNRTKLASATLTILFDENIKKIIFANIEETEAEIKNYLDRNRKNFNFTNENLKLLQDKIVSILNRPPIKLEKISHIQKPDSRLDLKDAMMKEIKKIKKPKKIEKKIKKSKLADEMVRAIKKVKDEV
ncbi:MAG: hypothetical protein HWN67_22585 [Candidatus Helarchaeota archaeon]|nr:hypothetical protein [Candidatus Helarchaeota archaeon]